MDQHELVYPHVYAGKFTDWPGYELVAGNTDDLSRQHHCFDPHDPERSCGSQIWNSISCISTCEFWNQGCKYPGYAESDRRLWVVWYSDMDRGRFHLLHP